MRHGCNIDSGIGKASADDGPRVMKPALMLKSVRNLRNGGYRDVEPVKPGIGAHSGLAPVPARRQFRIGERSPFLRRKVDRARRGRPVLLREVSQRRPCEPDPGCRHDHQEAQDARDKARNNHQNSAERCASTRAVDGVKTRSAMRQRGAAQRDPAK